MNFVAHIQSDQQRRKRFHNASVFQLPAIQRACSRNLADQFERNLLRFLIITAHQHVTVDGPVARKCFRSKILKRRSQTHARGQKFSRLLRCRALPYLLGRA